MIKSFNIMKAKPSDNPKLPTHSISVKVGEEFITVGACWTKDMKNGGKFLSCKLQDAWVNTQDNTKSRRGYGIIAEQKEVNTNIDPETGIDCTDIGF